jgi:hypothetical protein
LTSFDFQIPDESLKAETNYELIQCNSVPLCFNSFQILKETLEQVLKDKYIKSQEISFESMQQSCQSFQDPIADRLDDLCGQNHSSFTSHELKSCYDIDMIRQSVTGVCSAEASFQNPSEKLQPCLEVHEDANNITTTSNHEVELVKFEYPVIGQVYLDPVAIYMEKLFITGPQCIPSIFVMCRVYQAPCDEDQDGKHFMMPMQVLFLILFENIERAELLEKLLDWLHWHYCII